MPKSKEGETMYKTKGKQQKDSKSQSQSSFQTVISKSADKFFRALTKKIIRISIDKNIPEEEKQQVINKARDNIMTASNKQMAAKQMLKNIETNRTTANNLNDMVFSIKGPFPKSPSEIIMAEPSEKSSTSSKGKAHVNHLFKKIP